MTAMRLAEHVAHTEDVDGMLQRMTPDQFDEWCAKDRVEPIGHSTRCLGIIAHAILSYLSGSDVDADDLADALLPWVQFAPSPKANNALAKQMLGGGPRG